MNEVGALGAEQARVVRAVVHVDLAVVARPAGRAVAHVAALK